MKISPSISPTQLDTWTDCRLKWRWGREYYPLRRSAALDLGIGLHEALASYYTDVMQGYNSGNSLVEYFSAWADEQLAALDSDSFSHDDDLKSLVEIRTLGIAMLEGYTKFYAKDDFEVLAVEETVTRQLPGTDWEVEGRLDAIIRVGGGYMHGVYVLEHKSFSQLDTEHLNRDHQFVAESWLAESLEFGPVRGVLYNGLRKQIPSPRVKNPLFERHHIEVNGAQVKHWLRRCKSMHDALTRGKLAIYPEPSTMKCRFCQFKSPCTEYMRGGDSQFLLDTLFTTREERNGHHDD